MADLPGTVQALRETPPPARRGFTQSDQVHQLVTASEADSDLGFMARMMVLCSLSRTNPGNRHQSKSTSGNARRLMTIFFPRMSLRRSGTLTYARKLFPWGAVTNTTYCSSCESFISRRR